MIELSVEVPLIILFEGTNFKEGEINKCYGFRLTARSTSL